MCNINRSVNWFEVKPVMHAEAARFRDLIEGRHPIRVPGEDGFDLHGLEAIVGHDPVATPVDIPLQVEKSLRESGQYTPSFYNFYFNLFDAAAEDRQIQEFNESKWALFPAGTKYGNVEQPEDLGGALGLQLPYRSRRPVFVIGPRFAQNLAEKWKVRGVVGNYVVYGHE
jgi:hypothetical protein